MHKLFVGNPYEIFEIGDVICTTTNGIAKKNGDAVMGRGNAEFVRDVFHVEGLLGKYLKQYGNRAFFLGEYTFPSESEFQKLYKKKNNVMYHPERFENSFGKTLKLASFPTKHHWRDPSDLNLIETSANQMMNIANKFNLKRIYVPIPGGSNGKLKWEDIQPRLTGLDERFIVYSLDEEDFFDAGHDPDMKGQM